MNREKIMVSVTTWYVAGGLRADVDRLLQAFTEMKTYKFSDFSKLWREAKFSLIYMGRETEKEIREFTYECFSVALSYLCTITVSRQKVGALYLLYGLYLKQPFSKYKIRIQSDQWQEILSLLEVGSEENVLSIPFIINRLIDMTAFSFVAFPKLMGPRVTVNLKETSTKTAKLENLKGVMKEFVESSGMRTLHSCHTMYEDMKKKIKGSHGNSLSGVLESQYLAIEEDFKSLITPVDVSQVPAETCQSDNTGDGIGVRRAALKQTQFASHYGSKLNKRRNQLLSASESEGSQDEFNSMAVLFEKKNKRRKRRKVPKHERRRGRPKLYKHNGTEEIEDPPKAATTAHESDDVDSLDSWQPADVRKEKPKKTIYHFSTDLYEVNEDLINLQEKTSEDAPVLLKTS